MDMDEKNAYDFRDEIVEALDKHIIPAIDRFAENVGRKHLHFMFLVFDSNGGDVRFTCIESKQEQVRLLASAAINTGKQEIQSSHPMSPKVKKES